jgi:hypothetical protein
MRHKPPVFFVVAILKLGTATSRCSGPQGLFSPDRYLNFPIGITPPCQKFLDVQGGLLLGASEDKNVPKHALSSK